MTNTQKRHRGTSTYDGLPFSPLTTATLASMTATHTGSEHGWLTQHDIADALVQRVTDGERRLSDPSAVSPFVNVGDRARVITEDEHYGSECADNADRTEGNQWTCRICGATWEAMGPGSR